MMEIKTLDVEKRTFHAVIGNYDLTEGRGETYVKAYCETKATALRLGKKGYVQGGNCPVEERTLWRMPPYGDWLAPTKTHPATDGDIMAQGILDAQSAAIDAAIAAGLTLDQIELIRGIK
tara:strand:- start:294 stop:653 length:360 start_codon:yes stop_codon:yes gene_type:complete